MVVVQRIERAALQHKGMRVHDLRCQHQVALRRYLVWNTAGRAVQKKGFVTVLMEMQHITRRIGQLHAAILNQNIQKG